MEKNPGKLILYDGKCSLCNSFIRFVIKENKNRDICITDLNPMAFREEQKSDAAILRLNTMYFLMNGKIFDRSTAVLRILAELGGWYSLTGQVLLYVPKRFRDFFYGCISRARRKINFGKKCFVYSPEERQLFIGEREARQFLVNSGVDFPSQVPIGASKIFHPRENVEDKMELH